MVTLLLALLGCPGRAEDGGPRKDAAGEDSGDRDTAPEGNDTADTDTADTAPPAPDADGDGFSDAAAGGDDCDDADSRVYPGAPDACDGVDQDCDGDPVGAGACAARGAFSASTSLYVEGGLNWSHPAVYASVPTSPRAGAAFEWCAQDDATGGYACGILTADELWGEPVREPEGWRGWRGDWSCNPWPAGDVDGDGTGDLWIDGWAYSEGRAAYLLVVGPLGASFDGVVDPWTVASMSWQNTSGAYDGIGFTDAGGDLDGDGRAEALVSLRRPTGAHELHVLPGSSAAGAWGVEIASASPFLLYGEDTQLHGPQFLPDLDGDGRDDVVSHFDCGSSDEYGTWLSLALASGQDFQSAADGGWAAEDVFASFCPGEPGLSWEHPSLDWVGNRATDFDGDGHPDVLLGWHGGAEPEEGGVALVDLHDPGAGSLAERALVEVAATLAGRGADEVVEAYFGPGRLDDDWLVFYAATGYCLYRVDLLPSSGSVDRTELAAPCFELSAETGEYLNDLADLDGDGLPEWLWNDAGNYVDADGHRVGRAGVVRGFDIPYDDPAKW